MTKDSERSIRYSRQIAIDEIGREGQRKLSEGKVLVIGCGALGSMVAMQLCGAGVGEIGIVDFDSVDISNLQRQFFFTTDGAGRRKAELLQESMSALNPDCRISRIDEMMTRKLAEEVLARYDFIVDGTDNFPSKQMIEEVSSAKGLPYCIGGVSGFHGQVMTVMPGGSRFTDIFSTANGADFMPCSVTGVIGPAAALCASIQAAQVIKYLTGLIAKEHSTLITFDLLSNRFETFNI